MPLTLANKALLTDYLIINNHINDPFQNGLLYKLFLFFLGKEVVAWGVGHPLGFPHDFSSSLSLAKHNGKNIRFFHHSSGAMLRQILSYKNILRGWWSPCFLVWLISLKFFKQICLCYWVDRLADFLRKKSWEPELPLAKVQQIRSSKYPTGSLCPI